MTSTQSHSARLTVAAALSAAMLAGGTGDAVAASHRIHPAQQRDRGPSISIRVNPTTVRAGDPITVGGRVRGLRPGSTVQLEDRVGGRWRPLPERTTVGKGGDYKITVKFKNKGPEVLRDFDGRAFSRPVAVTVR